MGNGEVGDGMVRIDIADLERELRAALEGRAGQLGTASAGSTTLSGAGRNLDARGARRLRLVEAGDRPGGLQR